MLRRQGLTRVRPLAGGLAAWQDLGFPVEDRSARAQPAAEDRKIAADLP